MDIHVETVDAVTLVTAKGPLSGEEPRAIEARVLPLVSEPGHRVVVDLAGVDRIDSSGLGFLVSLCCRSNAKGGKLAFARPTMFVDEVIRVTKLDHFLVIASDLDEARRKASSDD